MEQTHKIDIKQALRVFNQITQKGKKEGDEWRYGNLTAATDFDGYTVFIRSPKVQLTIFFHNKYAVEYKNAHDLQEFTDLLQKLDQP